MLNSHYFFFVNTIGIIRVLVYVIYIYACMYVHLKFTQVSNNQGKILLL